VARRGRSTTNPLASRAASRSRAIERLRLCERVSSTMTQITGPNRALSRWRCGAVNARDDSMAKRASARV